MRHFIKTVDPSGELYGTEVQEEHLHFLFRLAAGYLNSLLAIPRQPLRICDESLDTRDG